MDTYRLVDAVFDGDRWGRRYTFAVRPHVLRPDPGATILVRSGPGDWQPATILQARDTDTPGDLAVATVWKDRWYPDTWAALTGLAARFGFDVGRWVPRCVPRPPRAPKPERCPEETVPSADRPSAWFLPHPGSVRTLLRQFTSGPRTLVLAPPGQLPQLTDLGPGVAYGWDPDVRAGWLSGLGAPVLVTSWSDLWLDVHGPVRFVLLDPFGHGPAIPGLHGFGCSPFLALDARVRARPGSELVVVADWWGPSLIRASTRGRTAMVSPGDREVRVLGVRASAAELPDRMARITERESGRIWWVGSPMREQAPPGLWLSDLPAVVGDRPDVVVVTPSAWNRPGLRWTPLSRLYTLAARAAVTVREGGSVLVLGHGKVPELVVQELRSGRDPAELWRANPLGYPNMTLVRLSWSAAHRWRTKLGLPPGLEPEERPEGSVIVGPDPIPGDRLGLSCFVPSDRLDQIRPWFETVQRTGDVSVYVV